MKIKVCDVCHKTIIYKNNGVKVEKLDVCGSCMNKILKKITQNNEKEKDSIMGPPDRYLGVL